MKVTNRMLVLAFFAISQVLYAQTTTEKTLVKSFDLQGKHQIIIDLSNGPVRVVEWDNDIARVEMSIAMETNENTLKSLIAIGRYNMVSTNNGESISISSPGLLRSMKMKGVEVKENVSYQVSVPKGTSVKVKDAVIGAL